MELMDMTCLVTGGSRGIGKACVEVCASKGARVFTCSRKQEDLDALVNSLKGKGYDVQGCICDVTDPDSLKQLMEKVSGAFDGKLDILVNNAGVHVAKTFMDHTREDFDVVMNTNVKSVIEVCQLAHPLLKSSGSGSVVNVGSIAGGNRAIAGECHYNLAKSAIDMLTRTLACEWAADGIRVNCVGPGVIDTDMAAHLINNPEFMAMYATETPLKRAGRPEEIANVVAFFASTASSYITGQTLYADGGNSVRGMGY